MTTYEEQNADWCMAAAEFEQQHESMADAVDRVAEGLRLAESAGNRRGLTPRLAFSLNPPRRALRDRAADFAEFLVSAERQDSFGNQAVEAQCRHGLGVAYFYRGDYLRALCYMYRSADISRSCCDDASLLATLQRLGGFNLTLRYFEEARVNLQEALRLARRLERFTEETTISLAIAECDIESRAYDSAAALLERVVSAESAGFRTPIDFPILNALSTAYRCSGRLSDAIAAAIDALAVARHEIGVGDMLRGLVSLGLAYAETGDKHACKTMEEAARLVECDTMDSGFADVALELGSYFLEYGQQSAAESLLVRGLNCAISSGHLSAECRLRHVMSKLYASRGDLHVALAHHDALQRAEQSLRRSESETRVMVLAARRDSERRRHEAQVREERNREMARLRAEAQANQGSCLWKRKCDLSAGATEDTLTGLYNRRYLTEFLDMEIDRTRRERIPLTVVIGDIDDFRHINGCFSHRIGDSVLRCVAELFAVHIRQADILARYGGEEFVVVLPGAERAEAAVICERIRVAVDNYPWERLHPELRVTISIGVADERSKCVEDLLGLADQRLAEAKRSGKNRMV